MPIVLAENEATESGITYEDQTGVSYEFPRAYKRIIQPGEIFVYYRGRRTVDGRRQMQVYFGTGIIGPVVEQNTATGRLNCQILDYRPFPTPVPFKNSSGEYFETGGGRRGYFQRGVRRLLQFEYDRIVVAAARPFASANVSAVEARRPSLSSYASPDVAQAVDAFAMSIAEAEVRRRFPGHQVKVMPHNNPGFDIEVRSTQWTYYVEVKGTQRSAVQFFASEGELAFSRKHAGVYRLVVVHGIDLKRNSFDLVWYEGAISEQTGYKLRPTQWACEKIV